MILRVLKLLVSLILLLALIWWTDTEAIVQRLRGVSMIWVLLAVLSLTVVTGLMARRWQLVAGRLQIEMPFKAALGEYYIGQMVNLILPGGVIGDVGRAVRIRKQGDLIRAAQSVAVERIIGQVAIFILIALGFTCAFVLPGGIIWPTYVLGGIVALLIIAAVFLVLVNRKTGQRPVFVLLMSSLKDIKLQVYGMVIACLLIFSLFACARATGTNVPPEGWFTLLPLILSAMLIPLSIAGWGWREGAAAALFPLIGASPDAGIATGIVYGGAMMVAASPALYFMVLAPGLKNCNDEPRLDCL